VRKRPTSASVTASLAFTAVAFTMVLLAENARIPVDNPATHLELTMIHEALLLEYSARHLALMEWAAALKLFNYVCIGFALFIPWGLSTSQAPLGLAVSNQPGFDRLARRRGEAIRIARKLQRRGHPQQRQAVRPLERVPFDHAGEQMPRRRQRRACEAGAPAFPVDHRHAQRWLHPHVADCPDVLQEGQRRRVAAHQHVLTVVDHLSRLAIGERGGAAAQPRPCFEDEDARAFPGQTHGRAQPGEAGTDHDDVVARRWHVSK